MRKKIKNSDSNPSILILEDDLEQMELLVNFALTEINKLIVHENTNDDQRQKMKTVNIIKVSNINSLKKAVSIHKGIFLAVLDCNTPHTKTSASDDQLVKTNHVITGQHKPVDIVTKHLPDTPITLISSMDRFQRIVNRYYESKHNLNINFIRKSNPKKIQSNIGFHLREYWATLH